MIRSSLLFLIGCMMASDIVMAAPPPPQQPSGSSPAPAMPPRALLDKYCVTCHSEKLRTGGLTLQAADVTNPPADAQTWENVVLKLRVGAMPPQGMPRPDKPVLDSFATYL